MKKFKTEEVKLSDIKQHQLIQDYKTYAFDESDESPVFCDDSMFEKSFLEFLASFPLIFVIKVNEKYFKIFGDAVFNLFSIHNVHKCTVLVVKEIDSTEIKQLILFEKMLYWSLLTIGGGTVDSAVFNVVNNSKNNDLEFHCFDSKVLSKGTMILHNKRIDWLLDQMKNDGFKESLFNDVRDLKAHWFVPDFINFYIDKAQFGDYSFDNAFINKLKKKLFSNQLRGVLKQLSGHYYVSRFQYPVFLVGGGSKNLSFQMLLEVNKVFRSISLKPTEMIQPENFVNKIAYSEYHRVSVAYGLSFPNLGHFYIGEKCLKKEDKGVKKSYEDNFISKDML